MTVLDIVHSLIALLASGAVFASVVARWPERERQVALYGWGAHALGAFVLVAVYKYYYGYGDLLSYFRGGSQLARFVEYDYPRHFPELVSLLFQQESDIPLIVFGAGTSTGSMYAAGGILSLMTSSLWAGSVLVASMTALGQVWLWQGMREFVPPSRARHALVSVFLVPSVVVWSSSLLKEAFALVGMGLVMLGAARLRAMAPVAGGTLIALGGFIVGLFKAYILFPLALAAGVYAYWSRAASRGGVRLRPVTAVMGIGGAIVVVMLLGRLFPAYSLDAVADSIEQQQDSSLSVQGGSDFRDADDAPTSTGGLRMVLESPYTVMTVLLRPFIVEARSAMMFLNSLETTFILYYLFVAFRRIGGIGIAKWIWRSPDLMACTAFVLLFSLAVGMATTNLGTLSRYRLPMMPFYLYLVLAAKALAETADERSPSPAGGRALPQGT